MDSANAAHRRKRQSHFTESLLNDRTASGHGAGGGLIPLIRFRRERAATLRTPTRRPCPTQW